MLVLPEARLGLFLGRRIGHRGVDLIPDLILLKLKRRFLILKSSNPGTEF